jgi:hypothetical protein
MFHFQVAVHAVLYATSVLVSQWQCSIVIAAIVSNLAEHHSHLAWLSIQSPFGLQVLQAHTPFAHLAVLKQLGAFVQIAVVLYLQPAKQSPISHPSASRHWMIKVTFIQRWISGHRAQLRGFA